MAYGVWYQVVDGPVSQDNLNLYGAVQAEEEIYREGADKNFCDGQTSPTGPRWADDDMGMLMFRSKEAAYAASDMLREDLAERFVAGDFASIDLRMPTWFNARTLTDATGVLTAAQLTPTMLDAQAEALRLEGAIPENITNGQASARIKAYLEAHPGRFSPEGFKSWIEARGWE